MFNTGSVTLKQWAYDNSINILLSWNEYVNSLIFPKYIMLYIALLSPPMCSHLEVFVRLN